MSNRHRRELTELAGQIVTVALMGSAVGLALGLSLAMATPAGQYRAKRAGQWIAYGGRWGAWRVRKAMRPATPRPGRTAATVGTVAAQRPHPN